MEIIKLELGNNFTSNCYILIKEKECVVIDPGFEDSKLYNYLSNKDLNVTKIILTHGHFDHWGGLRKLRTLFPKAQLYASSLDYMWYQVGPNNYFNYEPTIDVDLIGKDELILFDEKIKVIKTPGHSSGSVSLYFNKTLISGDVLFFESIGRTDLLEGNTNTLFKSIQNLYKLPLDTNVLPGHGVNTTIKHERVHNPFIKG
ncbi:MAG TPA: MBL fold metallo-hydrolase [Acholeplasmataceae bacterium]|nr:MBL fold metallo-hydrolase [Acholeplasmataceae bacterium]